LNSFSAFSGIIFPGKAFFVYAERKAALKNEKQKRSAWLLQIFHTFAVDLLQGMI